MKLTVDVGCLAHAVETYFSICFRVRRPGLPSRFLKIESRDVYMRIEERAPCFSTDSYLIGFELDIKRCLPPCPFEMRGGCDDVDECFFCKNITENATEYVSCYVNVKNGQAEFVFPNHQASIQLDPIAPTAAATISVPLTTTI
jgi:hypothetical protein